MISSFLSTCLLRNTLQCQALLLRLPKLCLFRRWRKNCWPSNPNWPNDCLPRLFAVLTFPPSTIRWPTQPNLIKIIWQNMPTHRKKSCLSAWTRGHLECVRMGYVCVCLLTESLLKRIWLFLSPRFRCLLVRSRLFENGWRSKATCIHPRNRIRIDRSKEWPLRRVKWAANDCGGCFGRWLAHQKCFSKIVLSTIIVLCVLWPKGERIWLPINCRWWSERN